jgi:3-oxoadipate enol-lactonase
VPLLWLIGEHDLICSPELIRECASLVPGSRFYEVKGAAHSTYFENPAEWNGVVLDFLHSQETGQAQQER